MENNENYIFDVATEIFNIGMGIAAESLSNILNERVILHIPCIEVLDKKDKISEVINEDGQSMKFISQNFNGDVNGLCLVSFHENFVNQLMEKVTGKKRASHTFSHIDNAAFQEIGNIILTSFMTGISDTLQKKIVVDIPSVLATNSAKLVEESIEADHLVYSKIEFSFSDVGPKSYLYSFVNFCDFEQIINQQ